MGPDRVVVSCALTGVLTNPVHHPVPVTPDEMAREAKDAYDAGASVMHIHFRDQGEGRGWLPSWDPGVALEISEAIREACPGVILNMTTGVIDEDISGPLACLEATKPEMAAMNSGSLNYLKLRSNGSWAWPPMLFSNPVSKIEATLEAMERLGVVPECECFDTGIVRSVAMFQRAGMLRRGPLVSFVMGVDSGMPANPALLPILISELPNGARWQTICIGRSEVWELHRETARLGGHLRTGLEDTFYLPNGERASGNGQLIEAIVNIARQEGREPASCDETRAQLAAYYE